MRLWLSTFVLAAGVIVLAMPSSAAPPVAEVAIQFAAYGPEQLDVLPGQTVKWTNVSQRTHTVTAYDGLFDSGDVTSGHRFAFRFTNTGTYEYHCTIHPSIVGEIDVRRLILDGLPTAAVPVGTPVEFDGRTATPARPVLIERRLENGSFETLAHVRAGENGTWQTTIDARATGDYRARSGSDSSESRRLLVSTRKVHVDATRGGLSVRVTPAAPYAAYLVERRLRERFGWWPVARGELDYVSGSTVRVRRRPAVVRVVLVDKDGWTPLAKSRPVHLPRR
ncbi:MAG TPA: cupredoxin domain-containing protein [Gaiella sp.]|nr:cupredoxin domain-containing protein [Gaiella sp.]